MGRHRLGGCIAGVAIGMTLAGPAAAQNVLGLEPDPSPAQPSVRPDPAPTRKPATPTSSTATRKPTVSPARTAVTPTAAATAPARVAADTTATTRRARSSRPSRHRPARRAPRRVTLHIELPRVALSAPAAHVSPADDGSGRALRAIAGGLLLALAAVGAVTLSRTAARARA